MVVKDTSTGLHKVLDPAGFKKDKLATKIDEF